MKAVFAILLLAAPVMAQAPYPPRITEHRTPPPVRKAQAQIGLLNFGFGGARSQLQSQQRQLDDIGRKLDSINQQPVQPQILQAPAPAGPCYDPAVAVELRRIGDLLQQQILLEQAKPVTPVTPIPAPQPIAQVQPAAPINIYVPRQELPANPPKQELPAAPPIQILPPNPPIQILPPAPPIQILPPAPPKQELPGAPQKQDLGPGVIKQEIQLPVVPVPVPRQDLPQQTAPPRDEIGPPTGYQRFTVDRNARWVPNVWHPVYPPAAKVAVKVYDHRY